jgi:hypothetical protein
MRPVVIHEWVQLCVKWVPIGYHFRPSKENWSSTEWLIHKFSYPCWNDSGEDLKELFSLEPWVSASSCQLAKALTTKGVEATRTSPADGIDRERTWKEELTCVIKLITKTEKRIQFEMKERGCIYMQFDASPMTQCMTEEVRLGSRLSTLRRVIQ